MLNRAVTKYMKSAVVASPGASVVFEDHAIPEPGNSDVLVKVIASGICHTDIDIMAGDYPWAQFPLVPGHEIVGRVVERGSSVDWLDLGALVGVTWVNRSCLRCVYCMRGDFVLCESSLSTGVNVPGGYQEYVVAGAANVISVPEALQPIEAAPLMCAGLTSYNGLRTVGELAGQRVAVLGLGGLGRYAAHFARQMGARVTVVSGSAAKRSEAVSLGAESFLLRADAEAELRDWDGGPNVIVSTAPSNELASALMPTLASDGHVVLLGIGREPLSVESHAVVDHRLTVHGSALGSPKDAARMLEFVKALPGLPPVVEVPFGEIGRGITLAAGGNATGRVVLSM